MTADLAARIRDAIRDRPGIPSSGPREAMGALASFQADPCASGWYGFVVRLGVLVDASEVLGIIGDADPFPAITTLALADASLARGRVADTRPD